jgi:hypothetical protein
MQGPPITATFCRWLWRRRELEGGEGGEVVRLSRARLVELGALASCILSHTEEPRTQGSRTGPAESASIFWVQGSGSVLHGNGFAGLLQPIFFLVIGVRTNNSSVGSTPCRRHDRTGRRAGGWGWARRGYRRAGMRGWGDKRISFLTEILPKLRFLWSLHLFVITQRDEWVRREG